MKKFLLIMLYVILAFIMLLYLAFLIVPPFINLDKYKADVQKLVLESSKLNLDYGKLKIYTTPLLSVGIIVNDVIVKLPDNSEILKTSGIKAGISLPSLITMTVKTANCYIENPYINLEIADGEQYKIVKIAEDLINENNAKPKETPMEEKPPLIDADKIKIKVPSIVITNYLAKVNDLKSNHSLTLSGEKLKLGYDSPSNTARFRTNAKLFSDDNENINVNAAVSVQLPKTSKEKEEVDPEEKIKIPFVNIVSIYQTYDLKMNADTKLKITESKKRGYNINGFLNVDNMNLKLSDIRLPDSYMHARFDGKVINYESNIYAKADEKIALDGFLKYGRHPRMKTHIQTDEIHFANLLDLLKGLCDSLNIKNDIKSIKATGYLRADATVKTNYKKLKSEGSIIIADGSFINPKYEIGIKDIAGNFIFDNNALNIKDTKATINNSKLTVDGKIDEKALANISLNVDNLYLPSLYNAFAPKELKNAYSLNNANLTAHIDVEGKLDNIEAKLKTTLDNLNVSDPKKTMIISDKKAGFNLNANKGIINGELKSEGFSFSMPQIKTTANINNLLVEINEDTIKINPFDLIYNNISKINIKGNINNYLKDPEIDIFASGGITTDNIKQTLGKDISHFMISKGTIPAKVSIKGNGKKQEILAQIYSDSNNYITPISLNPLLHSASIIQGDVKIQGNKIKIKNSGLYKKAQTGFSDDLETNMQNSTQIADFSTIIDGSHINLLRLNIPKEISGKIAIFNNSSFKTKGKVTMNGDFDNLNYGSNLKIYDLSIPEILFKLKNAGLDFVSKGVNVDLNQIDLNSSKINCSLEANLNPSKVFKVNNINVSSDMINVDEAMKVTDKLTKYVPLSQPKAKTKNTKPDDIPLYADGNFDIKKIKTGAIELFNTKGDLLIQNNNLYINKLSTQAFDGNISGDIGMNLLNSLMTIKLRGNNINADKMLSQAANMKDMLSGTMNFKTNISLKGATYLEQVKSLKGTVDFSAKNGQYGPFSRLENFFLAENVRENPIFKNTIGMILTPITTIDSSHYEELNGTVNFKNGVVYLDPVTSTGDILCILIKGNMNLVSNVMDTKVRVRLASAVSDLLGPIAMANPVNLIKNTPGLNIATAKLFSIFTIVVQESEYQEIPDFSKKHSDNNATKFQIILSGDAAKPLKLVKSFKWLALQEDMDKAKEFSDKYVKEQEQLAKQALMDKLQKEYESDNKVKVGVEKVLQINTTAPKVKEMLVEEVLQAKKDAEAKKQELIQANEEYKKQLKEKVENKTQEKLEQLQNNIKDKLETKINAPKTSAELE